MRRKLLIVGILAVLICSIIVPATADASRMIPALPIRETVANDQSVDNAYTVPPGSTKLNITTEWTLSPQNNNLMMQVVSPSGQVSRPYRDNFDNISDGRIPLQIESSSLESGTWTITITGESVIDVQPFTLTINVY